MRKLFASGIALVGLAACEADLANVEKDFLCEAQLGTPCTTLAEADGSGAGSARSIAERPADRMAGQLSQAPLPGGKTGSGAGGVPLGMGDGGTSYAASAYRLPEKIGTAWIAPYLDDAGILHEATWIHFKLLDAEWGERG